MAGMTKMMPFSNSREVSRFLVLTFSQDIAVDKKQLVFSCQRYHNVLTILVDSSLRMIILQEVPFLYEALLCNMEGSWTMRMYFFSWGVSLGNGHSHPYAGGDMKPQ